MTFTQITQFINDKIRNKTPKVVKIELADVQQAIVNEIYAQEFLETETNGFIFDKAEAILNNLSYKIKIKKTGKNVFLSGYIYTLNALSDLHLNIIKEEFKPTYLQINDLSAKIFSNNTVLAYATGTDADLGYIPQIKTFIINGLPFNENQVVRIFGFYTTEN